MKRQMKWAAASLICSLIIQCMPAAADQKTQEAFDAYLDRIYAQWISENPFQIHFYLEHPENYGIELSSYTLMDYSEYDEEAIEAYEKQQEEDIKELRSFDKTQLTRQQQILYDKLMVQIDLNEKYTDMFDFSSLIGGSNGIVNSLANAGFTICSTSSLFFVLKSAHSSSERNAASSSFFSKPSIKTFVFLPTSSSIASLLTCSIYFDGTRSYSAYSFV